MSDGCYGRKRSASVPISLFRTYNGKLEELKIQLCFYSRFLIILIPNRIYVSSCDAQCLDIFLNEFTELAVNTVYPL